MSRSSPGYAGAVSTTKKKIAVLHILAHLTAWDGISAILDVLFRGLDPDRFRLGICTLTEREDEVLDAFRSPAIELFALGRSAHAFDPATTGAVLSVLRRFRADIVHTHRNKGNYHGRVAGRLAGNVRIVTTHHDMKDARFSPHAYAREAMRRDEREVHDSPPDFAARCLYPWLNVRMNRWNDRVIAVSQACRDLHAPDPDDPRFEIVHAPFDELAFRPEHHRGSGAGCVLGSVGRLNSPKGHRHLVEAMKKVIAIRPEARLSIIGEGPCRKDLERLIRAGGLAPRVELRGALPHGIAMHEGIDILVHPSISEGGCALAVLEAMGSGLPVIMSDLRSLREIFEDVPDPPAVFVPPADPAALADAIVRLLDNPARATAIGLEASRHVHRHFTSRIHVERMTRLYEKLAEPRSS